MAALHCACTHCSAPYFLCLHYFIKIPHFTKDDYVILLMGADVKCTDGQRLLVLVILNMLVAASFSFKENKNGAVKQSYLFSNFTNATGYVAGAKCEFTLQCLEYL